MIEYINNKVEVYRNLRTGEVSVRYNKKPRNVVDSNCRHLFIKEAEFVVQEGIRQKVLKNKQKAVHAFIKGIATNFDDINISNKSKIEVTYNPYFHDKFIIKDTNEKLLNKDYIVEIEVNDGVGKKSLCQVFVYI